MFEPSLLPQVVTERPAFDQVEQSVGEVVCGHISRDFLRPHTHFYFDAEMTADLFAIGRKQRRDSRIARTFGDDFATEFDVMFLPA